MGLVYQMPSSRHLMLSLTLARRMGEILGRWTRLSRTYPGVDTEFQKKRQPKDLPFQGSLVPLPKMGHHTKTDVCYVACLSKFLVNFWLDLHPCIECLQASPPPPPPPTFGNLQCELGRTDNVHVLHFNIMEPLIELGNDSSKVGGLHV